MKQLLGIMTFILMLAIVLAAKQIKDLQEKYEGAMVNVKAYSAQLNKSKDETIAFQMTNDQLRAFGDSLMQELDATRKQLKIKEKEVKSLQYVGSTFTKTDTLILSDTLFQEPRLNLDTIMGNNWYTIRLALSYPSTIVVSPEVKSEKYIVTSAKRETVNPPKKFFLFRWFQKKHTVVHVNVVEKNPYIDVKEQRFVEIVK